MVKIKRYEHWTKDGKAWSKWFSWKGNIEEKWQLKNKLRNEYKYVTDEELLKIQEEQD